MINDYYRKLIYLFLANFYSSTITITLAGLIFPKIAYGQLQLPNNSQPNISQNNNNIKYPSIGSPPLDPNFDSDPNLRLRRYLLGPGDQLSIQVQRFPDLNVTIAIGPEGTIQMPLIGTVLLQNLTISEAIAKITSGLSQFIIDAEVSISLVVQRPVRVTIAGEITRPGYYPVGGNYQISDALSAAGGTTFTADLRNIEVRRTLADGSIVSQIVNILTPLQEGGPPPNLRLEDGDVVIIPSLKSIKPEEKDRELLTNYSQAGALTTGIITVNGEVTRPGYYPASQVSSALFAAGGASLTADLRRILVRRTLGDGSVIEEIIDLYTPLQNSTDLPNIPLKDGDAIIVPPLEPGSDFGYNRELVAKSTLSQQQITVRIFSHPNDTLATTNLPNGSKLIDILNGIAVDSAHLEAINLIRFDKEKSKIIRRELNGKKAIFGDSSQNILLQNEDIVVIDRTWINQINYLFEKYTLPVRSSLELLLFFRSLQQDASNLFLGGGGNNRRNNNRRRN
ncbi:polysaccharide export protein [Trichodesmium erythraeum IMS101]|uniref:Polysaccharide export protein n=1 Tax=Trichodesmium erythraeum (strain IMS101) TaxID=203124 RepID=Q111E4_TRIEI|nr:SLBB domain-containing protein [Trichodesmium erythraeum GBRTRLIN201]MCH2049693.1 SLBB domain-containing protein [Trichodesmium sp. ALOHA_ZT_67]